MTPTPIRNFQELDERLGELGYTERTMAQIRPEIRRAEQIYKQPLSRIAVDPMDFEARWGRGRVAGIAQGFNDHAQFLNFRKRLRGPLQRASGIQIREKISLPAASERLLALLRLNGGVGRLVPPHLEASVGALAKAAASHGKAIRDLCPTDIDRVLSPLSGGDRRSAKLGVDRLNDLIARVDLPDDIVALLPSTALPKPKAKIAAAGQWKRRGGNPNSKRLWNEFQDFVDKKRGRDALGRLIAPEDSNFGEKSEASYEHNLNLALTELFRRGDLMDGDTPSLRDICNAKVIKRVMGYWNVRQLDGEVKKEVATLLTQVCRLSHIAETMGAGKKERRKLAALRKMAKKACPRAGKMRSEHVDWVRTFASSPGLQRAVDRLPEALMKQSEEIISNWDALKKARKQKLMMDGLRMGIAACAAAILFRGSPVRAKNLRNLRFRGDNANVFLDGQDILRLVIPGSEVKNGKDIDHDGDDDAWPIIAWYLEKIRPKLIEDHPYLRGSRTPLLDSDFMFPSTNTDRGLEETAFATHYVRGCRFAGLEMTLHLARHITVYLILRADPNAWAQAAAVLGDNIATVKAYYAWLDERQASRSGRDLLRSSLSETRKHRKGTFNGTE